MRLPLSRVFIYYASPLSQRCCTGAWITLRELDGHLSGCLPLDENSRRVRRWGLKADRFENLGNPSRREPNRRDTGMIHGRRALEISCTSEIQDATEIYGWRAFQIRAWSILDGALVEIYFGHFQSSLISTIFLRLLSTHASCNAHGGHVSGSY